MLGKPLTIAKNRNNQCQYSAQKKVSNRCEKYVSYVCGKVYGTLLKDKHCTFRFDLSAETRLKMVAAYCVKKLKEAQYKYSFWWFIVFRF